MKNSKNNIEFVYEYRDAGGSRKSGSIVFSNPNGLSNLVELDNRIRELLFDTEFFYPYLVNVPLIHFDQWIPEVDHHWYRFEALIVSDDSPNDTKGRTIEEFITDLKLYAKIYEVESSF